MVGQADTSVSKNARLRSQSLCLFPSSWWCLMTATGQNKIKVECIKSEHKEKIVFYKSNILQTCLDLDLLI
jgi:hypothetical protein